MRISSMDTYFVQNLFSSIRGKASLPEINYGEVKNIQSGLYKKLLKKHYSTYNVDGKVNTLSSGELLDKQI